MNTHVFGRLSVALLTLATIGTLMAPNPGFAQDSDVSSVSEFESSLSSDSDLAMILELQDRIAALEAGRVEVGQDACGNKYWGPLASRLQTKGCPGLILYADFLFWNVRNTGFEYGITTGPLPQDGGPVGSVERLSTDYAPAFRVGGGFRFDECGNAGPEVLVTYTNFRNNETQTTGPGRAMIISSDNAVNTDADMDTGILVFPENVTPEDFYATATASYQFSYDSGDVLLAQSLMLTDSLTMRLSGGSRYVHLNERKTVTYAGGDFLVPLTAFHQGAFDGAGLIAGTQMKWNVCPWAAVNFGMNVGTLIGSNRTRTFIPDSPDITLLPLHIPTTPTDVIYQETRVVPMVELTTGIDLQKEVGDYLFTTSVGYDFVNYFNMTDTRVFSDAFQEGQNSHTLNSISLDGFYARFGINY